MEMESQGIRRSDRVTLAVPVEVLGTEAGGGDFFDIAETERISRYGASLVLRRKLAPDQELTLRNLENHRETEIRVIGQIGTTERGEIYGIAFTRDDANLWDIEFPSLSDSEDAAFRIVLGCVACKTREVAYLNEVEAEVFHASGVLRRKCSRCRESTVWREGAGMAPEAPVTAQPVQPDAAVQERGHGSPASQAMPVAEAIGSHAQALDSEDEAPQLPRTQNDRKHGRSRLKITVCIRKFQDAKDHWGADEEIAATSDVSRGGFGFSSEIRYRKGSHVEVAMPYKAGAPNIFVPAKIANVRMLKDGKRRYGVAYIAVHKGWPGQ